VVRDKHRRFAAHPTRESVPILVEDVALDAVRVMSTHGPSPVITITDTPATALGPVGKSLVERSRRHRATLHRRAIRRRDQRGQVAANVTVLSLTQRRMLEAPPGRGSGSAPTNERSLAIPVTVGKGRPSWS